MRKIRLLLVDDHNMVRQGLRVLLEAEEDIEVVGEAETGRQAVQMARSLQPDVIVMDIAMPNLNGLEATRQIVKEVSNSKVLVLSSYSDDEYLHQLTDAGASGYLLKQTAATDLIQAVRETSKGNAFFSPAVSKRLLDRYREAFLNGAPIKKRAVLLTTREAEVLQLIAEGKPNKQIAADLCISIKTVEKHRQQVMNKLNIHDIAGLTRYAISKGVIESGVSARIYRTQRTPSRWVHAVVGWGGLRSVASGAMTQKRGMKPETLCSFIAAASAFILGIFLWFNGGGSSVAGAFDDMSLQAPQPAEHRLRILTPTLLELAIITT